MTTFRFSTGFADAYYIKRAFTQPLSPYNPALLVSYPYFDVFESVRKQGSLYFRDYAIDSGAFTAHQSGNPIELPKYIEFCKKILKVAKPPIEIFALDVIGDPKASLRNTEKMWDAGIKAIPTFHLGSPSKMLHHIAKHYPKIAIGGVARKHSKIKIAFAKACFKAVWPKQVHGFGFGSESTCMIVPFHSVDSAAWSIATARFGQWKSFGKLPNRGRITTVREVKLFLEFEARLKVKWANEMKLLEQVAA